MPSFFSRIALVSCTSESQKEEETLHEATAGWTWEWIYDERIHKPTETERAVGQTGLEWSTSKNLVSKPENEKETFINAWACFLCALKKNQCFSYWWPQSTSCSSPWQWFSKWFKKFNTLVFLRIREIDKIYNIYLRQILVYSLADYANKCKKKNSPHHNNSFWRKRQQKTFYRTHLIKSKLKMQHCL